MAEISAPRYPRPGAPPDLTNVRGSGRGGHNFYGWGWSLAHNLDWFSSRPHAQDRCRRFSRAWCPVRAHGLVWAREFSTRVSIFRVADSISSASGARMQNKGLAYFSSFLMLPALFL